LTQQRKRKKLDTEDLAFTQSILHHHVFDGQKNLFDVESVLDYHCLSHALDEDAETETSTMHFSQT